MRKYLNTQKLNNAVDDHRFLLRNVIFFLVAVFIYSDFLLKQNYYFFNDMMGDSYDAFYHSLLKINDLFLNWKSFDFTISLGESPFIYTALLFDVLNWPLFIVPKEWLLKTMVYVVLFKNILLANLLYEFFKIKRVSDYSAFIFSVIFSFGCFQVLKGQVFVFSSILVYFTSFLLSVEIFIKTGKSLYLGGTVFLLLIHSPYACALFCIPVLPYLLMRFKEEDHFQAHLKNFIKISLMAFILSLPILIPTLEHYFNVPRLSGAVDIRKTNLSFFISLKDFIILVNNFIYPSLFIDWDKGISSYFAGRGINYVPILYSSTLGLILVFFVFKLKKIEKSISLTLIFSFCALISPVINNLFNLFQGGWYRWAFVPLPIIGVLGGRVLDMLMEEEKVSRSYKKSMLLLVIVGLSFILFLSGYFFYNSNSLYLENSLKHVVVLLCLYSILLIFLTKSKHTKFLLCFIILIEVAINAKLWVSKNRNILNDKFIQEKNDSFDNTEYALKKIEDNQFYRVSKSYKTNYLNDFVGWNERGTNFYWSFNNKFVFDFFRTFQTEFRSQLSGSRIFGADSRPWVDRFLAVKYVIDYAGAERSGYSLYENVRNLSIQKSDYTTSLFSFSDKFIDEKSLIKYSNNQDTLLSKFAVIKEELFVGKEKLKMNNDEILNSLTKIKKKIKRINKSSYKIKKGVLTISDVGFKGDFSKICLHFEKTVEPSTYVVKTKILDREWNNRNYKRYVIIDRRKKVCFPQPFINAEELEIRSYGSSLKDFNLTQELVKDDLKSNLSPIPINFENDEKILIKYSTEKDGIVVTTIPYSNNWTVYNFDKKIETLLVNKGFVGFYLPSGQHNLKIEYKRKTFYIGMVISILSFFCFIILRLIRRKNTNELYKTK